MRTVIVRVFEPAGQEGVAGRAWLHGVVEDVRTGERLAFRGGEELLESIARVAATAESAARNPLAPPPAGAPTDIDPDRGDQS